MSMPALPLAQMLISGGQQGLDIADMAAHVQYSGGYHAEHPVIQEFWKALATFSPKEQADFLRFVTSCPRPPLLGFKYLEPPLAIQVGGMGWGCWLMLLGAGGRYQGLGLLLRRYHNTASAAHPPPLFPSNPALLTPPDTSCSPCSWRAACWTSMPPTACPPPPRASTC